MKKSDIYEIAIKILGLYMVTYFIQTLVSLVLYIDEYRLDMSNEYIRYSTRLPLYIFMEGFNFLITVILAWLFIFNTKWIVKRICDPIDFEEPAKLFAERNVIYEIAFRITGLILVAWALPDFSFNLKSHIVWVQAHSADTDSNNYALWVDGLEIIFGCILLFAARGLALYFGSKKLEQSEPSTD